MSPRVEWLSVAGDPGVWRSLGFVVADDGLLPLPGTSLRIVAPADAAGTAAGNRPGNVDAGIVGWVLSGVDSAGGSDDAGDADPGDPGDVSDIDGLATTVIDPASPVFGDHPIGALGLDHVVVTTPDLERTSAAIASATGCELKRIREVGTMRQGFHRIGPGGLIVELVERPEVPEGPASFWGLVVNVEDLDAACALIGTERVSAPKDAVQPGRRIATVRNEVGLGLPVALMTP
jgi:hypothetical protein